jgi:hydroxymethylbilane synthase
MVRAAIAEKFPHIQSEVVVIKTSGDWIPTQGEVRLSEANRGKAQFAREIEEALLKGDIDVGVHSMKDMDSTLPEDLVINHMLPRQDIRDVLVIHNKNSFLKEYLAKNSQSNLVKTSVQLHNFLNELPANVRVGTASVRRAAFLLAQKPDLQIETLRGNVQTRIDKLRAGQVDITMLAMAGLNRLNLAAEADLVLSEDVMIPAAGQGAVGIEVRKNDGAVSQVLNDISCLKTVICVKSERAAVRALGGSCRSPIGAYAKFAGNDVHLKVVVCSVNGQQVFEDEISGSGRTYEEAETLGLEMGRRLKALVPVGILDEC